MAASTVPAAKQAVLDLLTARPALNEVVVTWGQPTENEDFGTASEFMFFESPVVRLPEWKILGGAWLDETYTLTLRVETIVAGDDRAAAEQRCWTLIDEIEQALRADRTLGGILQDGTERRSLDFDEQTVDSTPHSDAWAAYGVVPIVCHSRI